VNFRDSNNLGNNLRVIWVAVMVNGWKFTPLLEKNWPNPKNYLKLLGVLKKKIKLSPPLKKFWLCRCRVGKLIIKLITELRSLKNYLLSSFDFLNLGLMSKRLFVKNVSRKGISYQKRHHSDGVKQDFNLTVPVLPFLCWFLVIQLQTSSYL